jgi:hypothetical protein
MSISDPASDDGGHLHGREIIKEKMYVCACLYVFVLCLYVFVLYVFVLCVVCCVLCVVCCVLCLVSCVLCLVVLCLVVLCVFCAIRVYHLCRCVSQVVCEESCREGEDCWALGRF